MKPGNKLRAAPGRLKAFRVAAAAALMPCLAAGLYLWIKNPLANSGSSAIREEKAAKLSHTVITVAPRQLSVTLLSTGKLQPLQMINIGSPFSGKVERVNFHYGDIVRAGQVLMAMDVSETRVRYREARASYIKASQNLRELEAWAGGADVARAERSLAKAKLALENQKKMFEETERLYNKGIIPGNEYESARQQYLAQQLDYRTAEDEKKAIADRGSKTNVQLARLEAENARSRMMQLETELGLAVIVAPATGIVMKPSGGGTGKEGRTVERWSSFQQGEILVAIGDLGGFSVNGKIDETDVAAVKTGQKVRITGDAFKDVQLAGVVRGVSPQTEANDGQNTTSYNVAVDIGNVSPEQRKRIYVGMSANLEILICEKPAAVMLPISAVFIENGKKYVLKKQSGAVSVKTPVETGHTTLDSVEITKGIRAGDMIEVPGTPR